MNSVQTCIDIYPAFSIQFAPAHLGTAISIPRRPICAATCCSPERLVGHCSDRQSQQVAKKALECKPHNNNNNNHRRHHHYNQPV